MRMELQRGSSPDGSQEEMGETFLAGGLFVITFQLHLEKCGDVKSQEAKEALFGDGDRSVEVGRLRAVLREARLLWQGAPRWLAASNTPPSAGGQKSGIEVSAGTPPSEGPSWPILASGGCQHSMVFLGWWQHNFSVCPHHHMAVVPPSVSASARKDTNHWNGAYSHPARHHLDK